MFQVNTLTEIPVRMVLEDYDAAPDGVGTYTKLNQVFLSRRVALEHRRCYFHNMYNGRIEGLDGKLIENLEEGDYD